MTELKEYTAEAVRLLSRLIATPSVSRDEKAAADVMEAFMKEHGIDSRREANNVWAVGRDYDAARPTLLLNAHIDTVKPVGTWTRDPFGPVVEDDRLYGLGSNDCGGGLVALLQAFRILEDPCNPLKEDIVNTQPHRLDNISPSNPSSLLPYNLVFLSSAEEEVSGRDGISRVLPLLPHIDVAIVGEPTGMQPAIAEKGLMVIDATSHGRSGHAARTEGVNAIYEALDDLLWLRDYRFSRVSKLLGPVKMSVTVIGAGTQHNVIPDECRFVIDVRSNELYTNEELFGIISSHVKSELHARSFRLGSSRIDASHPLVRRMTAMGMKPFGSPTLSDQALMPFPSFKLGPGDSARSHSADEYICVSEIENAIRTYVEILSSY